jgi:hypothetical protein
MERLVAKMDGNKAKAEANVKGMKEEIQTARLEAVIQNKEENMEVRIDSNNEESEVRGTLVSRLDVHQARTEPAPDEVKARMDMHEETRRGPRRPSGIGRKTSCRVSTERRRASARNSPRRLTYRQ